MGRGRGWGSDRYALAGNPGILPQTLPSPLRSPPPETGFRDDDGEWEVKWDLTVHPIPEGSEIGLPSPEQLMSSLPRPKCAERLLV